MGDFGAAYETFWEAQLISEGVYLGSFDSAAHVQDYGKYGITHLLSLLGEAEHEILEKYVGGVSVKRKHIRIQDVVGAKEGMLLALPPATAFMHEAVSSGGACLVHCWQGVSRSSSCVVGYLMRYKALSVNAAYNQVRRARNVARPNPSFFDALYEWEKLIAQGKVDKGKGKKKGVCVLN